MCLPTTAWYGYWYPSLQTNQVVGDIRNYHVFAEFYVGEGANGNTQRCQCEEVTDRYQQFGYLDIHGYETNFYTENKNQSANY